MRISLTFELLVHMHCPKSTLGDHPFAIQAQTYEVSSGNMIYSTQTVKDLGVTVSADLSWTPLINMIAQRAGKVAAWVLSAFKTKDQATCTMMTLYKSLVRSHLKYCCPLWNCSKNKDIQQLEGIQQTFTSKIYGLHHLNYWQRLKALDLMSLLRRRESYLIILMWKVLHGKCPNDIGIQFSQSFRHGNKAIVPSIAKASSQRNQVHIIEDALQFKA
jgi:hypothetical protein